MVFLYAYLDDFTEDCLILRLIGTVTTSMVRSVFDSTRNDWAARLPISYGLRSNELTDGDISSVKFSFAVPTIPNSSGTFIPFSFNASIAPRAEKSPALYNASQPAANAFFPLSYPVSLRIVL